jgi:hypothetical protein
MGSLTRRFGELFASEQPQQSSLTIPKLIRQEGSGILLCSIADDERNVREVWFNAIHNRGGES